MPHLQHDAISVDTLERPLHDAGPLCVLRPSSGLGSEVRLRVWVPDAWPVESVTMRTTVDAELSAIPLAENERDGAGTWWSCAFTTVNPVHPYRFALAGPGDEDRGIPSYAWLTAAGIIPWDVADSTDFRLVSHEDAPDWVNDAVVYQIFPDRFARSAAQPIDDEGRPSLPDMPDWAVPMAWHEPSAENGYLNAQQIYGGDLDGIIDKLDHIQSLGANVVYLTPIFPAGSAHRYDATTFDRIDPMLGGDDALVRLSEALHERGMRLMLDLTTNHTGVGHEWFRTALEDPSSPEVGFYDFHSYPDSYRIWLNAPSLVPLDHSSEELERRMISGPDSIVGKYLRSPYLADGWRIDVAHMTGRNGAQDLTLDVARAIRRTMAEVRRQSERDTWLLAEHGHDATTDLPGDGWHGTMNYAGFTRPLWAWLSSPELEMSWLGLPMKVPHIPAWAAVRTLRDYNAHMSWSARMHSQNQLASHDTPRARSVVGTREAHLVALAAQIALPGVPTLFSGDELGLQGLNGEHSRTPMPWDAISTLDEGGVLAPAPGSIEEQIDPDMLSATRELMALRTQHVALRRGGLQWLHASSDAMIFLRTHPEGHMLVHLARDAHEQIDLDLSILPQVGEISVCDGRGAVHAEIDGMRLRLFASGPGSVMVALIPPTL